MLKKVIKKSQTGQLSIADLVKHASALLPIHSDARPTFIEDDFIAKDYGLKLVGSEQAAENVAHRFGSAHS